MKRIKNYISVLIAILAITCVISACNKSVDGSVVDSSIRRFFTPSNLKVRTRRDSAIFTFTAPLFPIKGMTYTIELSQDSAFSTIDYAMVTDTTTAVATDSNILLSTSYYARMRVNAYKTIAASNNYNPTGTFRLYGLQYLKVVRDLDITQSSVVLHWYLNDATKAATTAVLTPSDGSASITVQISQAEAAAGSKGITGLDANKHYKIQLFAVKKSLGFTNFITPRVVSYTTTITAGVDDLAATIDAAADGDVIGLNPGTYTLLSATPILHKTITIRSVSNNPADTKILSPELDLVGDGAGISLAGVEVSGNYTGTTNGTTFLQLYGDPTANTPSTFSYVNIDNCIIHDYTRCVIRGNYAAVANDFKIGSIVINNSQIYNVDVTNTSGYYMFSLEKMLFTSIIFKNSTFHNLGEGLFNMSTALGTLTTLPSIFISYCTMNNIGGNGKYLLFDANANALQFLLDNSILANTPMSGTLNAKAFRASATSSLDFSFNNTFKFTSNSSGLDLVLTGLAQGNDFSENLGWLPTTTNFSLAALPSSDPIFTASSGGGTIGDGRWAY